MVQDNGRAREGLDMGQRLVRYQGVDKKGKDMGVGSKEESRRKGRTLGWVRNEGQPREFGEQLATR
jgi:hypothetical protein